MTATAPPTASDWIARADAVEPRNEAFIDGRFVPLKTTWIDLSGG